MFAGVIRGGRRRRRSGEKKNREGLCAFSPGTAARPNVWIEDATTRGAEGVVEKETDVESLQRCFDSHPRPELWVGREWGGVLDRMRETTDYHQLAVDELTQTNRSMLKLLSLDHGNLLLHPEPLVLVSLNIFILKNYTSLFFLEVSVLWQLQSSGRLQHAEEPSWLSGFRQFAVLDREK